MKRRYTVQFYTTKGSAVRSTTVTASNESDAANQVKRRYASSGHEIHIVSVTAIQENLIMKELVLYGRVIEFGSDIDLKLEANNVFGDVLVYYTMENLALLRDYEFNNPDVAYKNLRGIYYSWLDELLNVIRVFANNNGYEADEKELYLLHDYVCSEIEKQLHDFELTYEAIHNIFFPTEQIIINSRNKSTIMTSPEAMDEANAYVAKQMQKIKELLNSSAKNTSEVISEILCCDFKELWTKSVFRENLKLFYDLGIDRSLHLDYCQNSFFGDNKKGVETALINHVFPMNKVVEALPILIMEYPFCSALYTQEILDGITYDEDKEDYLRIADFSMMDDDLVY